ncbi:MAG TPA: nuclear transport factor 2 family protein [Acidimicrobiia bacterium]|jgi:ketosteroid isomerase-like protein|nr:nuclear transport factor 2 family protein [Acidimicrobiia bacterium]
MSDGVIETYLDALVRGDWETFADCLADDGFTRVGPYGDVKPSKPEYVAFLADLMPTLPGYSMDVTRVTYVDSLAFAELSETVEVDGTPLRTPECLTFELAGDGRIRHVEVFTQTRAPV